MLFTDTTPDSLQARLQRARDTAVSALLAARDGRAWWTGELSASALSTATAITALTVVARGDASAAPRLAPLIRRGFGWLIANQHADGGWGDTTRSRSNISTTMLGWAALALCPDEVAGRASSTVAAEGWLKRAAGSTEPDALVTAIERRYGDDRTFSIPILTMSALCGRLGAERDGWRRVRQLPFELAALPQCWFGALQLPVVSYALPALIAIGQVRHGMAPTSNPLLRTLRNRCRARTLEKLEQLQPANGGFLEAAPLTSFVTMSLAALGHAAHPVVRRGVAFLEASVRADGSWPIDTNLATWVTTLAVNALASTQSADASRNWNNVGRGRPTPPHLPLEMESAGSATPPYTDQLSDADRRAVRDWLLGQQYRRVHPYTLAAPGGWAWTDRPGGVPDADDTAGAVLALAQLDPTNPDAHEAMAAGARWLLDLQNRDGGVPTFCRGWGRLPFDRSSPDITAHTMRAWRAALPRLAEAERPRIDAALARARSFLHRTQQANGTWIPLWFGHQEHPAEENPLYGTTRVLLALLPGSAGGSPATFEERAGRPRSQGQTAAAVDRALQWLIANQNADGGWSGAPGAASSIEETGLAVETLAAVRTSGREAVLDSALRRGAVWLADAIEQRRWVEPAPIGFYFAKLWYFERLYPLLFATGALTRMVNHE